MSDSQHRAISNPDMDPANAPSLSIGRGTGFTIKQVAQALRDFFKRKKIPSHQWRTKKEKDRLLKRRLERETQDAAGPTVRRVQFGKMRQHAAQTGVRKFSTSRSNDVWRRL